MKKQKICSLLSAGVISSTVLVAPLAKPAFALDGIPSSNQYTFGGIVGRQLISGNPISSEELNDAVNVLVKDKNGTVEQEIKSGQSIASKTGTITWKDSYENVTAFYLHANPGYEIEAVYVDGKPVKLIDDKGGFKVEVNSDLGKDKTYEFNDEDEYEKVFYFTSAGKEAWAKNHTFEIKVNKVAQHATVEVYDSNLNGAKKVYTTEEQIPYGVVDTKILGFPEDSGYYIVGGNNVDFDGNPIKVVKRPNSFGNYKYGFTYVGDLKADLNIKSVKAYWNGNKENLVPVNLNETLILNTGGNLHQYKLNFVVEVKKGHKLKGKLSNGKELKTSYLGSTKDSEIYGIEFTRVAHHGYQNSPVHEMFSLQTEYIKK